MAYSPSLDDLRAEVNADIETFLAERRAAVPEAAPLIDEIGRVVALGGKRLRPAFCYWGFRASGGEHSGGIVRMGSALELLHTFALVHDDIMDEADTRRGRPSTHVLHDAHFALLAGDLALVLADAAFSSAPFGAARKEQASAIYSRMKQEVIAGQFLDYRVAETGDISEDVARRIAVLKSGLYSVVEPLTIGAQLGGADAEVVDGLRRFGEPLGEAFQLRDDLLGLFGDEAAVGKPVGSDVSEGKRTLLYVWTVAQLDGEEAERFVGRWGASDLTSAEIRELTAAVSRSGARARVESLLSNLTEQAAVALGELPVGPDVRAALEDLVRAATDRLA